ncbi:hypothetical protein D3C85_925390 [compost metagenome]
MRIQAALDLQRTALAHVALEALAVVAHLLDDVVGPLLVQPQVGAAAGRDAQDALDVGVGALGLLVHVLGRHAVFFGFDHRRQRPAHDVQPGIVALAHERTQRLLGNDLGQHDVIVGVLQLGDANRSQARRVRRKDVAAAGRERVDHFVEGLDHDGLVAHVVGARPIGQRVLVRGAGLEADRGAVDFLGALHAQRLRHQEALAVIEVDARMDDAQRRVALLRHSGVARQHVHFAGLQRGETLLRIERHHLDLVGVAEDRRGNGAAQVHVQALPLALRIGRRKAREARGRAASHGAALAHDVQRCRLRTLRRRHQ